MSFLIERVREGAKNFQIITWPGSTLQVKLRVLARAEYQEANFAAHRHFMVQEMPVMDHTLETYEEEKIIQLLYRALEEASGDNAGKPVAATIDEFRANVTKEEVDELAKAYAILEEETSPNSERMGKEEFERFLDLLKKKPEQTITSVRSIAFARRLLRSMAVQSES